MAKTADQPAGTAGSQFYVVTGGDAGLPPDYAVLGRVAEGNGHRPGSTGSATRRARAGTPLRPSVLKKASVNAS